MEALTITPPGMRVGWWIEVPGLDPDDEAAPVWARIESVLAPEHTGEHRWAVLVRSGTHECCWFKAAPHLWFPVCDVDPAAP